MGDPRIIKDNKLRKLFLKSPEHHELRKIDFDLPKPFSRVFKIFFQHVVKKMD